MVHSSEHFEKLYGPLRALAEKAGVPLETKIVAGHAAEQIVNEAAVEHADLIVVGYRGKSLIQRRLLGSVSKHVTSYAPGSVVISR